MDTLLDIVFGAMLIIFFSRLIYNYFMDTWFDDEE